jgi:hypothetical protein
VQESAASDGKNANETVSTGDILAMTKWHLERYDRLRASTSSRASVVLSAGALLSAGNAVLINQFAGRSAGWMTTTWSVIFAAGVSVCAAQVIVCLILAAQVLVTLRGSRAMVPDRSLPPSLLFNAADTIRHAGSFPHFQELVAGQSEQSQLEAAQIELWVGINQHRRRYVRLRQAVIAMCCAAASFLVLLAAYLIVDAILRS